MSSLIEPQLWAPPPSLFSWGLTPLVNESDVHVMFTIKHVHASITYYVFANSPLLISAVAIEFTLSGSFFGSPPEASSSSPQSSPTPEGPVLSGLSIVVPRGLGFSISTYFSSWWPICIHFNILRSTMIKLEMSVTTWLAAFTKIQNCVLIQSHLVWTCSIGWQPIWNRWA